MHNQLTFSRLTQDSDHKQHLVLQIKDQQRLRFLIKILHLCNLQGNTKRHNRSHYNFRIKIIDCNLQNQRIPFRILFKNKGMKSIKS